jgi:molybdate transport system regulatory protein
MAKKPLALAGALGHLAADKRVEILRRVGQGGSISQAARDAGVSYKAAWQALDTLSNLAGAALVERVVGGAGGGGAQLTAAGEQLLHAADALSSARDQVLARLAGQGTGASLAALGLRTSMRNQLPCTVVAVRTQGQAMRIELQLEGGAVLRSRITKESAQLLGLHAGQSVLALCKATGVQVMADGKASVKAVETGNLLRGVVARASRSAVGGEVALDLEAGLRLVGFCAPGTVLKLRSAAVAKFDESAVVIAVAGGLSIGVRFQFFLWIPAFAGMTAFVRLGTRRA